jgi:hypothetical protein
MWAVRIVHEASLWPVNSFVTLTYAPDQLPQDGSLDKSHFQKFMKRLRKRFPDKKIRYFHCGEYGEQLQRPHYHAILFNVCFDDAVLYKINNGQKLYTSPTLESIWGKGYAITGDVTFQSAAYVARYCLKKVNGEQGKYAYDRADEFGTYTHTVEPEYATMSRRPGIGKAWFEQFKDDVFPDDFVVLDGKKYKVPRYYDQLLGSEREEALEEIKKQRVKKAKQHRDNNAPERLLVREQVQLAKAKLLRRPIEETSE